MNQQPGWERKKAQTRAALAQTAAEMFREHGFDGVTAAEIAKAAGTSERTFFRYFETKEDVLFLDIREILDGLRTVLAEPPPDGLTRREQLEQLIVQSTDRIAAPGEDFQAISIANWLHEPAITRKFGEYVAELEGIMMDALAQERGVAPDADLQVQLQARLITAGYMSAFAVFNATGGNLAKLTEHAFAMIESGDALKPPPRRRRA